MLIDNFSLERVTKAPASFDPKKLWAFQDHYMQALPLKQRVATMLDLFAAGGARAAADALRGGAEADADRRGGRRPPESVRRHSRLCRLLLSGRDHLRRKGFRQEPAQARRRRTAGEVPQCLVRRRAVRHAAPRSGVARRSSRPKESRPATSSTPSASPRPAKPSAPGCTIAWRSSARRRASCGSTERWSRHGSARRPWNTRIRCRKTNT